MQMRLILRDGCGFCLTFNRKSGRAREAPRLYLETRFFEVILYISIPHSSKLYFEATLFEPFSAIFTNHTVRTYLPYFAVRLFEVNLINKIIKIGR